MNRTTRLGLALLVPVLGVTASRVAAQDAAPPVQAPRPAPGPAPAAPANDPFALGDAYVDEAMRYIAKGNPVIARLDNMHADIDYSYDDGSTRDERRMELWFRNPDAFRANFQYAGRDSTFLLVAERGFLIRDQIRVTPLNESPTMKEVLPMLKNYRAVLQEVSRMVVPKAPGARFRFEGMVPNAAASGGQWFRVARTAPGEPMMTYFFGSAPRRDGGGLRAIAPDRLIIHGEPGSNYQGDEYRLEDWARDGPQAQRENMRYPKRIRLYAIGIDPEERPTMRAVMNSLEVNTYIDPQLLTPPF